MNNPLSVSPSKGNQGATRGKEKIFWPRLESNPRPPDYTSELILCSTLLTMVPPYYASRRAISGSASFKTNFRKCAFCPSLYQRRITRRSTNVCPSSSRRWMNYPSGRIMRLLVWKQPLSLERRRNWQLIKLSKWSVTSVVSLRFRPKLNNAAKETWLMWLAKLSRIFSVLFGMNINVAILSLSMVRQMHQKRKWTSYDQFLDISRVWPV